MSMNEADLKLVLSQFLLRDETSESPKIHPRKIEKSKTAIQNKLAIYIEELENNEININLSDYKMALKQMKKMKASEYEEVVIEIVEDYELLKAKKKKVFPSASSPYPEQIMNQTIEELSKNKQVIPSDSSKGLEDKNEKSKLFLFSNNRKRGQKN